MKPGTMCTLGAGTILFMLPSQPDHPTRLGGDVYLRIKERCSALIVGSIEPTDGMMSSMKLFVLTSVGMGWLWSSYVNRPPWP